MTRPADVPDSIRSDVWKLTGECRASCLWYLRADYYPETAGEMLRCLEAIQRHGNLEMYKPKIGI